MNQATKGIGTTLVGGAKTAGDEIKGAWSKPKNGTVSFGHRVKNFVTKLFND